jgi:D-amino-acid dehydrogenase
MMHYARQQGAQFACERIVTVKSAAGGMDLGFATGATRRFDLVVLAAGIWSRQLGRRIGEHLPLEAERGYNLTYPAPPLRISHPIVFADRGVVASAIDDGLRVGGWAELGGLRRPPQPVYFQRIEAITEALFPALAGERNYRWMGLRPSTPGSVPIVRRSCRDPRIMLACGHGHLGLTQAPSTARMIRRLATNQDAGIAPDPLSAQALHGSGT